MQLWIVKLFLPLVACLLALNLLVVVPLPLDYEVLPPPLDDTYHQVNAGVHAGNHNATSQQSFLSNTRDTTTSEKLTADVTQKDELEALGTLVPQTNATSFENTTAISFTQMDIMVPVSGVDDKLRAFCKVLGDTIRQNQPKITVRLLVTRYQGDDATPAFKNELKSFGIPTIVFVTMPREVNFTRSTARNALHRTACTQRNCIATGMDVDMQVRLEFLDRAPTIVVPGKVAYFPIVWSEMNPATVKEVDEYYIVNVKNKKLGEFSLHKGLWRSMGKGMYAVSGPDIDYLRFNESFVGWGGEDINFFKQVEKRMEVRRVYETGLIHTWHKKDCGEDSVVKTFQSSCVEAKWKLEGSQFLGQSLMISRKLLPNKPRLGKGLLIIHVGPPFTSESEMMHRQLTELSPFLAKDQFTYHGRLWTESEDQLSPLLALMHDDECFKQGVGVWKKHPSNETMCLKHRRKLSLLDGTRNHIVSDESFSTKGFDFLAFQEVMTKKFEMRIVISYKHYFEWLLDSKYQLSKSWEHGSQWRNETGLAMMGVHEWVSGVLSGRPTRPDVTNRDANALYHSLLNHFPVQLLNYHEANNHPVSHWLCTMLPLGATAPNACKQSMKLEEQYTNDKKLGMPLFEYDRLVWEASEKGWIPEGLDRRFVAAAARKYVEVDLGSTLSDFEKECPSDEQLTQLVDRSLVLEKNIFPYQYNESDHRAAFKSARDQLAFCSISVEKVLADPMWVNFFGGLTQDFDVPKKMQRDMGYYSKQR